MALSAPVVARVPMQRPVPVLLALGAERVQAQ